MAVPAIDTTYGAALIGLVLSSILYGVTLLQTFLYFRKYPQDPKLIKSIVLFLCLMDTIQLALCTTTLYWYLITNFDNPDALFKTTWSINIQTDCNGLIGLVVECFFARRVWILSRNILITVVIVILAFIHFSLGIVFTIEEFLLGTSNDFEKLVWVTSAGIGSAAAADILITVSLCWYLLKSRTGFSRTNSLITSLIKYSLTTGLLTSILATVVVITFAVAPTEYFWLAFFWLLGKCYVNSLLAVLNSRGSLRERAAQPPSFYQFSDLPPNRMFHASDPGSDGHQIRTVPLAISVHRATVSKTDYTDPNSPMRENSVLSTDMMDTKE